MTRSAPTIFAVSRGRLLAFWCVGLGVLLTVMTLGVLYGATDIAVRDVGQIVFDRLMDRPLVPGTKEIIIWRVRFPRPFLAAIVGAGLGVVGVAVQATVRNSLADPYLLGISSGASLGAVVALVTGGGVLTALVGQTFLLATAAFIGAMMSFLVVWLAAGRRAGANPLRMILAGIAVGQVFASLTSFLVLQADDVNLTQNILHWLMGSLSGAIGPAIPVVGTVVGVASIALFGLARPLNSLMMGDETADSLGVSPAGTRAAVFVVTSLMTGVMVAFSGAIGFIGLVIPHIARFFCGTDHRRLLPTAALCGAILLSSVDLLCRMAVRVVNQELPINVLAAVIGAPVLLYLINRKLAS